MVKKQTEGIYLELITLDNKHLKYKLVVAHDYIKLYDNGTCINIDNHITLDTILILAQHTWVLQMPMSKINKIFSNHKFPKQVCDKHISLRKASEILGINKNIINRAIKKYPKD